jgi:hypothetical protein
MAALYEASIWAEFMPSNSSFGPMPMSAATVAPPLVASLLIEMLQPERVDGLIDENVIPMVRLRPTNMLEPALVIVGIVAIDVSFPSIRNPPGHGLLPTVSVTRQPVTLGTGPSQLREGRGRVGHVVIHELAHERGACGTRGVVGVVHVQGRVGDQIDRRLGLVCRAAARRQSVAGVQNAALLEPSDDGTARLSTIPTTQTRQAEMSMFLQVLPTPGIGTMSFP